MSLGHLKTGFKYNLKNVPVPILKLLLKPLIIKDLQKKLDNIHTLCFRGQFIIYLLRVTPLLGINFLENLNLKFNILA